MVRSVHVLEHAAPVDDEERPAAARPSIVDHVVGAGGLEVRVAQVGEIETAQLLRECAMRGDVVRADGQDLRVELLKLLVVRPKSGQLARSARGIVARIEGDEGFAPAQAAERYVAVRGRGQREIWRGITHAHGYGFHEQLL